MADTDVEMTLSDHDAKSDKRAHHIVDEIHKAKHQVVDAINAETAGATTEGTDMTTPVNVFHAPAADHSAMIPAAMMAGMGGGGGMGGAGAGLGAGLLGGLLGGVLFGGGLGGFGGDRGFDRQTAPLNGTDGMAIINAIGNVKDVIGATGADILASINNNSNNICKSVDQGFAAAATNTLQQSIMLIQEGNRNAAAAATQFAALDRNISDQGCSTRAAIGASTTTITTLINQLNTDSLNRQLTVADLDRRDAVAVGRSREVEVNVTQNVNQQQLQLQAQQQQQQQLILLSQIAQGLANVTQIAHATNSNVIAGNTGAVTTGAQTSTPTNVNA